MKYCCKCKKRKAIIFVQKIEGSNTTSEGYCLKCARDLGIKPIEDMIDKMGIPEDQLESLSDEMDGLMGSGMFPFGGESDDEDDGDDDSARAPSIDLSAIFGNKENNNDNQNSDTKAKDEKKKNSKKKSLEQFCINLSAKAGEGKIDKVIGRDRELERVIQILCRRQKNNPCLIGEPGVGKTAVAEALAVKILNKDVPYKLRNHEVYMLDMTSMVAGTQFRGQFENRMKLLIEEIKKLGNIILVIDEVHSIVSAGDAEGGMNAANILKPALSRGEIQVIGATTLAEYRKFIEKDSALERRFQPVVINEPSLKDSIDILRGIKGYYEKFHGVIIPDETVEKTVIYSERYITDRYLPDKAIDLLDESASYLSLRSKEINDAAEKADELALIKTQSEQLELSTEEGELEVERYQKLADLKTRELQLEKEVKELEKMSKNVILRPEHLAKVVEIWTGIPASSISESEFIRIDKLEERLKNRIVGQDKAISAVAKAIKRSRAGISAKRKPVSFIFAGPTGVGKTELVKTLASDLFDTPEAIIRLDMSEFMEKHAVSRIIGAPPGYVGYDEAGQLTEKVRRRPYCVILFDEIEKAHPDVMNILLQILDDGRITDAHGKEVSFANSIIVMTTNAGSHGSVNSAGFNGTNAMVSEDKIMKALSEFLRPEFINRIDEIITFNSLNEENFADIAKILLSDLVASLSEKGIEFAYTDESALLLAKKSFSLKYGARNLRRYIQTEVEDKAAEIIIANYDVKIKKLFMSAVDDEIKIVTGV